MRLHVAAIWRYSVQLNWIPHRLQVHQLYSDVSRDDRDSCCCGYFHWFLRLALQKHQAAGNARGYRKEKNWIGKVSFGSEKLVSLIA